MKFKLLCLVGMLAALPDALAQATQQVVDIATRPGVTQRMLVLSPPQPKAAVVLLAGGHGGLQMASDGSMKWGAGNFLVCRSNNCAFRCWWSTTSRTAAGSAPSPTCRR
jgi:hypothetical protein